MADEVRVNSAQLHEAISSLERAGRSFSQFTPTIAEMLVAETLDVLGAEGPGWPPLAASTLAKRRREGRGAKMLQDTGVFAASVHGEDDAQSAMAATNVPHIVYSVSDAPRTVIPYRNPFDFGDQRLNRVLDEVTDLLLGGMIT